MTKIQFIFLTAFICFFVGIAGKLSAQVSVTATLGTTTGSYTTVKAAFNKINDGTHKGDIAIKLSASTTETASAVLNASSSPASYTSVTLYPTAENVVISGAIAEAALIDLNGADFATIDGRVNATGSTVSMKIENTSTSATSGTSTVCFRNDALGNSLQYCYILGASMATTGGIIYFASGSSSGNNNNMVISCNITNSGLNRPVNAVYSYSSSGVNAQNSIISNNFYDFFNAGADSYGINLSSGTSNFSIYYNSFYETTSFVPSSASTYYSIYVNNTSGTQFNISNNYIGGTATICGGTALTKSTGNNVFYGIRISSGTSVVSNVNGNIIKNITWANSGNAPFYGIAGSEGDLNIGTAGGGNIIGASSGNGSITYTAGATGGIFYGICCMTSGSISVAGNTIGAVTADNSVNLGTNLYGIYCGGANTNPGNTISGNTLLNLVNGADGSTSLINGIYVGSGKNSVTSNTVHDLSIDYSNNTLSNYELSAGGIVVNVTTTATQTITGNTVYNISNTYSGFAGSVTGIYYSGPSTVSSVSGNFIYSVYTSSNGVYTSSVYGIKADAGSTTFANNIISMSGNSGSILYGIHEPGTLGNNSNLYFNTVYFAGGSCTLNSFCLYSASNANARNFRNNILNNYRSSLVGAKAYCIYYAATAGTLTTDYNDYDGSLIGYYGTDCISLAAMRTANSQDVHSLNLNPNYILAGSTTASDYYPREALPGVDGTGITTDYSGATRASTPTMGAIEGQIVVTWIGGTSTNWSTTTNWTQSKVPVGVQNVTIPSGTTYSPHITTDPASYSSCNNLTIASGAVLTIDAGKSLAVYGTLTNSAGITGLVLKSDASGTGMLRQTSAGVSATVERYYPAPASWSDGSHGWHFLSAPVTAQSVAPEFWEQTATAYDFYAWWEPTNEWVNYKNDHTPPVWFTANVLGGTTATGYFIPGKGYLAAFETTKTRSFTGTLNAADIPISGLTNTGSATYKGFNLLGNPFPCPIDWNAAVNTWGLSNIDASCQIWNESSASYTVISSGGLIPESNGFMVHVTNTGSGSLTIPASAMRINQAAPWYKSAGTEENRIVLKAIDAAGQTAQETIISFDLAATDDFDPLYDSYFLAGYAPMFYSVSRNKDYALKCLPELNSSLVVPLSFIKNNSSEFGIELITNIPGTNVYLTDLKLNKTQNLANDPVYLFSSAAGDAAERFQLSFVLNGTGKEKKLISEIYAWENSVYVRNQGTSELQIYNLKGQTVFSERISQQGLCRSVLNVPSGYYIARLTGDAGVTVKKIHINN